jgi:hypothetical protein
MHCECPPIIGVFHTRNIGNGRVSSLEFQQGPACLVDDSANHERRRRPIASWRCVLLGPGLPEKSGRARRRGPHGDNRNRTHPTNVRISRSLSVRVEVSDDEIRALLSSINAVASLIVGKADARGKTSGKPRCRTQANVRLARACHRWILAVRVCSGHGKLPFEPPCGSARLSPREMDDDPALCARPSAPLREIDNRPALCARPSASPREMDDPAALRESVCASARD